MDYYKQPVRVLYRTKRGTVMRLGGYGLVARMRAAGRLVAAWSTSTGKGFTL